MNSGATFASDRIHRHVQMQELELEREKEELERCVTPSLDQHTCNPGYPSTLNTLIRSRQNIAEESKGVQEAHKRVLRDQGQAGPARFPHSNVLTSQELETTKKTSEEHLRRIKEAV